MQTLKSIRQILDDVRFRRHDFIVKPKNDGFYLQVVYVEGDVQSGVPTEQHGRKWLLSPHMTKSEIVQTAFKAVLTSEEHRAREHFTYKGKRIFGPHFDVDDLVAICENGKLDVRAEAKAAQSARKKNALPSFVTMSTWKGVCK